MPLARVSPCWGCREGWILPCTTLLLRSGIPLALREEGSTAVDAAAAAGAAAGAVGREGRTEVAASTSGVLLRIHRWGSLPEQARCTAAEEVHTAWVRVEQEGSPVGEGAWLALVRMRA